jgi:hypothetical protein
MKNSIKIEWKIKLHIFLSVILFICKTLSAQDTITLVTGTKLLVEIKEINDEYVLFSLWPDTIITRIPIDRVQSSSYMDGKSILFNLNPEEVKLALDSLPSDSAATVAMARIDARNNYKNSSGAGIGSFVATVLGTPILGLFVAIPVSSTPPSDTKLNPPNKALFENKIYYDAYRKEAHKIKKGRVWTGFGLGVTLDAILVAIIYSEFQDGMDIY